MSSSPSPSLGRTGSGSGRYSSMQVPVSDVPLNPSPKPQRMMFRSGSSLDPNADDEDYYSVHGGGSGMYSRNASQGMDRGSSRFGNSYDSQYDDSGDSPEGEDNGGGHMSLMALLAVTDREMGLDGSTYTMGDDDDYDDEDEEEEEIQREVYSNCCVCMVRHKGDAFTACGHSYCRLCSRELLVERGSCPLCNNFIMEVLHIF